MLRIFDYESSRDLKNIPKGGSYVLIKVIVANTKLLPDNGAEPGTIFCKLRIRKTVLVRNNISYRVKLPECILYYGVNSASQVKESHQALEFCDPSLPLRAVVLQPSQDFCCLLKRDIERKGKRGPSILRSESGVCTSGKQIKIAYARSLMNVSSIDQSRTEA